MVTTSKHLSQESIEIYKCLWNCGKHPLTAYWQEKNSLFRSGTPKHGYKLHFLYFKWLCYKLHRRLIKPTVYSGAFTNITERGSAGYFEVSSCKLRMDGLNGFAIRAPKLCSSPSESPLWWISWYNLYSENIFFNESWTLWHFFLITFSRDLFVYFMILGCFYHLWFSFVLFWSLPVKHYIILLNTNLMS